MSEKGKGTHASSRSRADIVPDAPVELPHQNLPQPLGRALPIVVQQPVQFGAPRAGAPQNAFNIRRQQFVVPELGNLQLPRRHRGRIVKGGGAALERRVRGAARANALAARAVANAHLHTNRAPVDGLEFREKVLRDHRDGNGQNEHAENANHGRHEFAGGRRGHNLAIADGGDRDEDKPHRRVHAGKVRRGAARVDRAVLDKVEHGRGKDGTANDDEKHHEQRETRLDGGSRKDLRTKGTERNGA
jgi:hypothetical protein